MVRKRYVIPIAVGAAAGVAVAVGVMQADAAVSTSSSRSVAASSSPSPSATSAPVKGVENCAAGGEITAGKYWLNNNQWGKDTGTGTQCVTRSSLDGDTLAWSTTWDWTGQQNSVKSYASAVLGWHWGWKAGNTGLPVRLSDREPVNADWDFTVKQDTPNTMNVAYDLWLHDVAEPDWQDQPTDEIMVWLYHSGGAGPVGTRQATVTIGGTSWDLYRGNIGWNVYSFVRTDNAEGSDLDLRDFTDDLTARAWLPATKYLSSVQAGTEIFTGSGTLDTDSYSVRIG
ncbi:GH12 family glycosyl hydrolase domain-containing protein [Winogradskya humida]|uniref:Glycosyl hydrolase family 12 n=1 Tax=Winogradskya humida TaxID=113566 RepID=A0ABQ3ZK32_9ACTN|nr:hypothetical protein [Actinoplanes humidus]GIE18867.1 hypothetical protein Ahu01nite_019690 [Actinoplanes humidus]